MFPSEVKNWVPLVWKPPAILVSTVPDPKLLFPPINWLFVLNPVVSTVLVWLNVVLVLDKYWFESSLTGPIYGFDSLKEFTCFPNPMFFPKE